MISIFLNNNSLIEEKTNQSLNNKNKIFIKMPTKIILALSKTKLNSNKMKPSQSQDKAYKGYK